MTASAVAVRLGHFATVRGGDSYVDRVQEAGVPVYGAGGLLGFTLKANATAGEIIVGRVGSVGSLRLLTSEAWATDNTLLVSIDLHKAEPRFVIYSLREVPFAQITSGTAMPLLTGSTLMSQAISLPPLREQRAIADYLDRETARIDALIEEQRSLVRLLEERRGAVLVDPFRSLSAVVSLGSVLDVLIDHRGKTPGKVGEKTDDFTDQGVPVISAIHIKDGQISWGERERFVPYWMFEKWMPVRLRKGDVLLTSEAPLGNVAQVPSDDPLVLSQRLFAIRGREGVLDSTYLRFFLECDRGQSLLRDGSSGSTVSGIRQSRLIQIPVPVPPIGEQRRVVHQIREQITKIDALTAETERFIELARERRAALITAAVEGQIDVREAS